MLLCLFALAAGTPAAHAFTAQLQGLSFGSNVWQTVNLTDWKELDLIPCRVYFTDGPASNQVIQVDFDHTKTSGGLVTPGIQNLFNFTNSSNIIFVSGPTLSAPLGVDTWSYFFTVNFTSATNFGFVEFRARLSAGAHNFTGSSLQLKGQPSLSTLQISKPGPVPGNPDLAVTKMGPDRANPGSIITYSLSFTNQSGSAATGGQLSDTLPSLISFLTNCTGNCSVAGPTVTWDLGDIPRGASGSVVYQVVVTNFAINGQTFQNSATVLSAENDANYADNSASVTTTITNGCIPPSIVNHPAGATNCPGTPVTFSVLANGTALAYQWRKNGDPIPSATASSFTLNSVTGTDTAAYDVLLTNLCGNVPSSNATLAVLQATTSTPLTNARACPGDNVLFSTTTSGTGPFAYIWRKAGAQIDGQTNNFLTLNSVNGADAGGYCVEVAGACNSVTNCATLTVNTNTTAAGLVSLTNCSGTPASFSTTAHGTGPFTYQWTRNGTNISGATNNSLTLPSVTADDAGTYSVQVSGVCNRLTNFATLTVNTLTTADPLFSRTNCAGDTVSFATTAHGTGPFTYQWTSNGTNISGATGSSLTLSSVTAASAGAYSVRVSGVCNSVTNFATLTVNTLTTADPLISQTNCPGTITSFSTTAHGTGPFTYQWTSNGTNISGATDSSLTLPSVTANNAGTYSVRVSGVCNSVTNLATLTVNTPTTADPLVSQTNCAGDTVSFTTTAHGTGPFSYQWVKEGKALPGATVSSWVIANASALAAGTYSVRVSGLCNAVTNSATLTVNPPTMATALANQTQCFGQDATFSTIASGTGPFSYVWKKDGNVLANQTSGSITLHNLEGADAGTYTVEVMGQCGSATNSANLTVQRDGLVSPATFANPGLITINDFSPATPYPSTIEVGCVPSRLTRITVTITNLSHTYAADVDILLISPAGLAIMLMSDAGGTGSISNAILGFDDAAPNSLPESAPIVTGVYKPTNYGASDNMPAPAPQGPYVTTLAAFTGSIPNGTWSLYVVDDAQVDAGNVSGGWSLTLGWGTAPPPPRFISPSILSDGSFQATLQGQPGKTYVIEASVDLTSWTPLSTNTLSGQTGNFVDPHNPSLTQRFYRAVAQP